MKLLAPIATRNRNLIKSVVHASEVLSSFHSAGEILHLREVVERTGFGRTTCYRFLYTLKECGLLEKVAEDQYRLSPEKQPLRRFRIGYSAHGQGSSFEVAVLAGLRLAAEQNSIELIVVDNRCGSRALRGAEQLIRDRVDLVIEFQTDHTLAAEMAGKYRAQNIPMIAADIPHTGTIYFGANNYEAGLLAGRHLGRWAKLHWEGTAESLLLVGLARAGRTAQARLRGVVDGVTEMLGSDVLPPVCTLEGDGQFGTALAAVRQHLRRQKEKRILIGASNDLSALGALRAFEEAGRGSHCAVIGHNGELEARAELREPRTRLIGSVAFFPEEYGDRLIRLALAILAKKTVPAACFVRHKLITPENVDHFYPHDPLLASW